MIPLLLKLVEIFFDYMCRERDAVVSGKPSNEPLVCYIFC
jgi:hypothetical protein